MFLNQRQIWLLSTMIGDSKSRTSVEFAKKLLVTSRTIISDMSVLKDVFTSFDITLVTKKGEGISLEIHDVEKYQELHMQIKKRQLNSGVLRSEFRERVMMLFRIIINKNSYFTLDELSDELYVSKNAFLNEMRAVKLDLDKYSLKLLKKSHYGYYLEGKEMHIRNAIIDSYEHFADGLKPLDFISNSYQFDEDGDYQIKEIVINALKKYQVSLGVLFISKVERSIFVFEKRQKLGKYIELSQEELSLVRHSRIMAIIDEIVQQLQLDWRIEEKIGLGIQMLTMIEVNKDEREIYFGKYIPIVDSIYNRLAWKLNELYSLDFDQYLDLSDMLYNILLSNKYVTDFKVQERFYTRKIRQFSRMNPISLELAIKTCFLLKEDYFLNRGMLFSLVYLYNNYFSKIVYEKEKFLNVSIVSNYKKNSVTNYEQTVNKLFKQALNKISIIERYEINETDDDLYICVNDQEISGKDCIEAEYYYNENELRNAILNKVTYKMFDYSLLPSLEEDDIIDGFDINSLDELLVFLSSIFTRNTKESLKLLEYFKFRQEFVSYDNEMNNILVIPTLDQTIKGIKLIRLEKPLLVRNYYGEYVIYLSLDSKDKKSLTMIKDIMECIMHNPSLIERLFEKEYSCKNFYIDVMKIINGVDNLQ